MQYNTFTRLLKYNIFHGCSKRNFNNGFTPVNKLQCLDQLVDILYKNTLYFDKNILVLNKPYGLQKYSNKNSPPSFVRLNPAALNLNEYSLEDALPGLCHLNNIQRLTIVKCPDRYMSGITILASNEKIISRLQKCMRRAVAYSRFPKYQAVCVGVPKLLQQEYKVGYFMEQRNNSKDKKISFTNTWSKNDLKRNDVNILRLHYKVLSVAEHNCASLLEITSNKNTAHCVRAFLAGKILTPVLGDHLYSSRVKYLFGHAMVGDDWSQGEAKQFLLPKLKEKLGICKKNEELTIPEHIHLSRIELPLYTFEKQDLILESHISSCPTYSHTLNTLDLSTSTGETQEKCKYEIDKNHYQHVVV